MATVKDPRLNTLAIIREANIAMAAMRDAAKQALRNFGVFEYLSKHGGTHYKDIAASTGLDNFVLHLVLQAIAQEPNANLQDTQDGIFVCTAFTGNHQDQKTRPSVTHPYARMFRSSLMQRTVANLEKTLQTGRATPVEGLPFWEYQDTNPEERLSFQEGMSARTDGLELPEIFIMMDFSSYRTVVDLGGGHSDLIIAIAQKYPDIQCINFERGTMEKEALSAIKASDLLDRCTVVSGDFLSEIILPHIMVGPVLFIAKRIIWDWPNAQVLQFLKRVHRAMPEDSKLAIMEQVVGQKRDDFEMLYIKKLALYLITNLGTSQLGEGEE